jgi:hypothetical protein
MEANEYDENDSFDMHEIEIQKKKLKMEILDLEKKKLIKRRSVSAGRRSIGFYSQAQAESQPDF